MPRSSVFTVLGATSIALAVTCLAASVLSPGVLAPPARAEGREAETREVELDATPKECHPRALAQLKRLAPEGWKVYEQTKDKSFFTRWITCENIQLGLTTAVHETVHLLTEGNEGYPLIMGGKLPRVSQTKRRRAFFPPRLTSHQFDDSSNFVTTYLKPGAASSADEFDYLLNEFNAYTHDLHAAIQLVSIGNRGQDVYHRDGLAALMSFVAAYVERARTEHPDTWKSLQEQPTRRVVTTLWAQAEQVMANSCRLSRYGFEATGYLTQHVCKADIRHGLGELLGRPPLCPVTCVRAGERTAMPAANETEFVTRGQSFRRRSRE